MNILYTGDLTPKKRSWMANPLWGAFFAALFWSPLFIALATFASAEPKFLNTAAVNAVQYKIKPADQPIQNSAALTNDDTIWFYAEANTRYKFNVRLQTTIEGAGDLKCDWDGPASPTSFIAVEVLWSAATGFTGFSTVGPSIALNTVKSRITFSGKTMILIDGYFDNGTTPGPLHFRFAQNTASNVGPATVQKGSAISWQKVN